MSSKRYNPSVFLSASAAMHVLALGSIAIKPTLWPFAVGALVIDHAGLVLGGLLPRCRILGPNMTRMQAQANGSRAVALTFDDGPDLERTPRVLDVLHEHNAKASFFCIGRSVAENPSLVRDMVERGHRIENHTWSHPNTFAFLPPAGLSAEMGRAQSIITEVTGRAPKYFRAPAGIRSPWLDPVLHRLRLRLISWTRRGFDTVDKDPDRICRRLLNDLAPADILLLHDGGALGATDGGKVIEDVLPRVLREIKQEGLEAVPIP